ncbi:MAG: GNAT family N-acetyltransferase [Bacteroidetes bacterium RIFCSPHIGHO2_02_FULL_44_7]|nr:MAG: GNAT family N-acetyltransferase [Bacteroidetes bacterium RIFCSPHIGHO2_02_FULL_44_7]
MKLTVREVQAQDAEALAELSGQLGYASTTDELHQRIEALMKGDDHCVFVALDAEKVIGWTHGFYALRLESEPFVEIGGLVVDSAYRKKGIGKLLLEKIDRWTKTKQCHDVRVRCNILRKESHLFYERLGFVEQKVQKIFRKKLA